MMAQVEVITPEDQATWHLLRGKDITASVVGALFGEHEYVTEFELWAMKTGRLKRHYEETPAMQRGRLLEPVAVQLLKEQFPKWRIDHNAAENRYYRDPAARLGATPDVIVDARGKGRGVIQIKSVEASIYRRKWLDDDGQPEPPLWIALQAALEAHLTNSVWAAVAPLVIGHGIDLPLIDIPLVPGIIEAMQTRAAEFWGMVEAGEEPTPRYSRDASVIDRIYAVEDDETEVDLTANNFFPELLEERAGLQADIFTKKNRIEEIDALIKATMGNAAVAHIPGGRRITWRTESRPGGFTAPSKSRVLRLPKGFDQ